MFLQQSGIIAQCSNLPQPRHLILNSILILIKDSASRATLFIWNISIEIMVSQIIPILEGDKAEVKWNERIVDPDNFPQQRQIDVLVRIL